MSMTDMNIDMMKDMYKNVNYFYDNQFITKEIEEELKRSVSMMSTPVMCMSNRRCIVRFRNPFGNRRKGNRKIK